MPKQKKPLDETPSPRRKRRSPEEIMQRLVHAASEEFKECGFRGATTAAIARRAEVTEAQLFRYFDSKAEIFQAAIFKPLSEHLQAFNDKYQANNDDDGNIRDRAQMYIGDLQDFIADHSKLFLSLIVAEAYASETMQGVSDIESLRTYFQRGADSMNKRTKGEPKVDPQLMVRVSFVAVLASVMFKDWIFPEGLASDKAIRQAINDFVIDGINANTDPGLSELRPPH